MPRITITNVSYNYENMSSGEYKDVTLNFISNGFKFNSTESVVITREQYEECRRDDDKLRSCIVNKLLADIDSYVDELNEYKQSLMD